MIRNHSTEQPQRRIAIVKLPQRQPARLGIIRSGEPARANTANVGWATISDQRPDNASNWMASVLRQQSNARLTTPGTFSYTPASRTPAPNVAPWNSWVQPNCDPAQNPPQFPGIDTNMGSLASDAGGSPTGGLMAVLGIVGAIAAGAWLMKGRA